MTVTPRLHNAGMTTVTQPLGVRSAAEVWRRQTRWARLRRATFKLYFLPELLTGSVPALIAGAVAAAALELCLSSCRRVRLSSNRNMNLSRPAQWRSQRIESR
jgi:hypothetical protein